METLHVEVRLDLGRLVLAGDATQGVHHCQDPMTGQFLPIVGQSARPRRKFGKLRWGWGRAFLGAATAVSLLLAAGAAHHFWVARPAAVKQQAIASLPIGGSGEGSADALRVVNAPYRPPEVVAAAPVAVASAAPLPLPAAAPVVAASAALKREAPPAAGRPAVAEERDPAPTGRAKEPAKDEPTLVFNEPFTAKNPETVNKQLGASTPAAPARAPASSAGAGGVRLVAIKDANTIVVNLPGNVMPVPLKPGARLPTGATIVSADPARGSVLLNNGTMLVLE
jgi:hypothetical protein